MCQWTVLSNWLAAFWWMHIENFFYCSFKVWFANWFRIKLQARIILRVNLHFYFLSRFFGVYTCVITPSKRFPSHLTRFHCDSTRNIKMTLRVVIAELLILAPCDSMWIFVSFCIYLLPNLYFHDMIVYPRSMAWGPCDLHRVVSLLFISSLFSCLIIPTVQASL